MPVIPAIPWTANSTVDYADQSYQDGLRPSAGGIYADADYPAIPTVEPDSADQRFLGGAGASDSNDGTSGTPWLTFDKAMTELCASSTWYCLNISADTTVSSTINTKFYGSGPGTTDQFAYVRQDPSEATATLTINARVDIDGADFWLWYGFDLSGTAGITLGQDSVTEHHTFRDITSVMTGTVGGDNLCPIGPNSSNADYMGIFNCNYTGPGIALPVHQNTSAIVAFVLPHFRFENNEISNYPRDIYFKHSNVVEAGVHIRFNWCKSESGLGSFFAGRDEGGTWEIVDNIFETGIAVSNGGGGSQPDGITLTNNTIQGGIGLENGNNIVINCALLNNIIETDYSPLRFGANTNTNTSNYSLINGSIYYQSTTYTLASWQAGSTPAGQDANSIAGLPTYTGGSSPTTVTGFLLNGGNGVNAGSDGNDIGADTTLVGNK